MAQTQARWCIGLWTENHRHGDSTRRIRDASHGGRHTAWSESNNHGYANAESTTESRPANHSHSHTWSRDKIVLEYLERSHPKLTTSTPWEGWTWPRRAQRLSRREGQRQLETASHARSNGCWQAAQTKEGRRRRFHRGRDAWLGAKYGGWLPTRRQKRALWGEEVRIGRGRVARLNFPDALKRHRWKCQPGKLVVRETRGNGHSAQLSKKEKKTENFELWKCWILKFLARF